MKHKISISVDEKTVELVRKLLREDAIFRNKSHVFEYAVKKMVSGK